MEPRRNTAAAAEVVTVEQVVLSPEGWTTAVRKRFARAPVVVQAMVAAGVAACLLALAEGRPVPFIYFQF